MHRGRWRVCGEGVETEWFEVAGLRSRLNRFAESFGDRLVTRLRVLQMQVQPSETLFGIDALPTRFAQKHGRIAGGGFMDVPIATNRRSLASQTRKRTGFDFVKWIAAVRDALVAIALPLKFGGVGVADRAARTAAPVVVTSAAAVVISIAIEIAVGVALVASIALTFAGDVLDEITVGGVGSDHPVEQAPGASGHRDRADQGKEQKRKSAFWRSHFEISQRSWSGRGTGEPKTDNPKPP